MFSTVCFVKKHAVCSDFCNFHFSIFQVKVWDTSSGFSYVTFDQHTGGVTDLTFIESGKAIVSCSQDGTVRAFDLNR